MSIDLSQFHEMYFDESLNGLDSIVSSLLDAEAVDSSAINTMVTTVHLIKDGAETLGFVDVFDFTRMMETLLDDIENANQLGAAELTKPLVEAVDLLRNMLINLKENILSDESQLSKPAQSLATKFTQANGSVIDSRLPTMTEPPASGDDIQPGWKIDFRPHIRLYRTGNDPLKLLTQLESLGKMTVVMDDSSLPVFIDLEPEYCYLAWQLTLEGDIAKQDVIDIFQSVDDYCDLTIEPLATVTEVDISTDKQRGQTIVENKGMTDPVDAPLTSTMIDSQIICVAGENYIIPSATIIETLEINTKDIKQIAGKGALYLFQDQYVPLIRLADLFSLQASTSDAKQSRVVIVDGGDQKVGLFIDELLEQQQAVIFSLATNYRKVDGISAATIVADDVVVLILDIPELIDLFKQSAVDLAEQSQQSELVQVQLKDISDNTAQTNDETVHYVSFMLGEETYGVELVRIQQIRGWEKVTYIPNSPHYLSGVLHFSGTIIPLVDLRQYFGLPTETYSATTVVIALKVQGVEERTVAIVADAVSDTHEISPDNVKPAPDLGTYINTQYISGLVPIADQMMTILNIDQLLSSETIG